MENFLNNCSMPVFILVVFGGTSLILYLILRLFSWFFPVKVVEESSQLLRLNAFVETVKKLSPEDRAVIKDFIHDILPDKLTK